MKFIRTAVALLIILLTGSLLIAGEIYTWTNENGILIIMDQPPPEGIQVQHVTRYKEENPEERKETRGLEKETIQERLKRQNIKEIQQAKQLAEEARKEAESAINDAQEADKRLRDYIEKYGSRNKKQKMHRSKIRSLADTAEAAKVRAEAAVKRSNQAAEKSWEADNRAEETEDRP